MKSPLKQLGFPARALRYFKDSGVPGWRKLVALFAVLYVASPVDAIPDVLPIIGWLDDVGVMAAIGWFFVREIDSHTRVVDSTVDGVPRDEQGAHRL